MIVAVAIVVVPATIPGPSEGDTLKFIVNISSPSTMLSFTTGMFTVLLLVPAVILTVCDAELKSVSIINAKWIYVISKHIMFNYIFTVV